MKTILMLSIWGILSINSYAQEIQPGDSLFAIAKSEKKKVLLYFSGSDWCAPCIRFKKNYIEKAEFSEFAKYNLIVYNADFPRYKMNQLNKKVVEFNEVLAEKYNKNGTFPKIILMDMTGVVLKEWLALPTQPLEEFINSLR